MRTDRHPVVVQQVEVGGRTVTFDLVQWFQGDAAARAAAEDGEESPPPNDYYIRNVNPRLRTLPVAADARLTLTRLTVGQGGGNAASGVPVDLATVAANGRDHLFWATVQGGGSCAWRAYIPDGVSRQAWLWSSGGHAGARPMLGCAVQRGRSAARIAGLALPRPASRGPGECGSWDAPQVGV